MTFQCVTFGDVCDILCSVYRFTLFIGSNANSDLWDSYKRGQLLGNEGIAGSPMSASVPAWFKDGLS